MSERAERVAAAPAAGAMWVKVATLKEVAAAGLLTVQAGPHTLVLACQGETVRAVDNRCPHMGFPLDRGTVEDGMIICHWHHARFCLHTGGTFDPWADDVRAFPTQVAVDGTVSVDVTPPREPLAGHRRRLRQALERDIALVIAKATIHLLEGGEPSAAPFATGVRYGTLQRANGWGAGLTILTAMMNLAPRLGRVDRTRAFTHGLCAVARETAGNAPRTAVEALPGVVDVATCKRWLRSMIESRDADGAERCVATAVAVGATRVELAEMMFAAVTDHRYLDNGHPLDFTNKALEALDHLDWDDPAPVLASLVRGYANAGRAEEARAWQSPVDLVALLREAFVELPAAHAAGAALPPPDPWREAPLVELLLGEDPAATVLALLDAVRAGVRPATLAATVAYAAGLRVARLHISNEHGDWDRAHHTFTFSNAVHQGLCRAPSAELLRGVFDAAMSIYLDRFLNVPPARLPVPDASVPAVAPAELLEQLAALFDRQQQVDQAGALAGRYLYGGGDPDKLIARLGALLVREDRDFHTIQDVEAAVRQFEGRRGTAEGHHLLIATTRYLAAHAPTMRAQDQRHRVAWRLFRGDRLYEADGTPTTGPAE